MSRKTVDLAAILLVGTMTFGLVGCGGGGGEEAAPPDSEAVTTDQVEIDLPDAGGDESEESTEGEDAESEE